MVYPRHCEPTDRANASPMTGSAKQSILSLCRAMDCFASLAMTAGYTSASSRRDAPGVLLETLLLWNQRAQGRPDARCTRGLACDVYQRMLHTSIQVQRRTPGLPCAMALRLIRVSPGDRLSCHHHRQKLSPSHDLTPAPGRQAHTTSPYASGRARQSQPSRPPLPAPRLRRWPTPLWWDRMAGVVKVFLPDAPRREFSYGGIDQHLGLICPSGCD
jgi:hypothetical protein